jgi:hypothetical protein
MEMMARNTVRIAGMAHSGGYVHREPITPEAEKINFTFFL